MISNFAQQQTLKKKKKPTFTQQRASESSSSPHKLNASLTWIWTSNFRRKLTNYQRSYRENPSDKYQLVIETLSNYKSNLTKRNAEVLHITILVKLSTSKKKTTKRKKNLRKKILPSLQFNKRGRYWIKFSRCTTKLRDQ